MDKRSILFDLCESGTTVQDAYMVLYLHREKILRPRIPIARENGELIIAKDRDGPLDTVHIILRRAHLRVSSDKD